MRSAHHVAQVREAEDRLLASLPGGVLMQRAATGLAYAVMEFLGRVYGARVVLLVGAGNNGGDALYAGAHLARRGARVDCILLAPDKAHAGGLAALVASGGRVVAEPRLPYDVAVDGIVGIGGSGPLREDAAALVAGLGPTPIVAVDVPSGVDVDRGRIDGPHVQATLTVTFGTHKVAHLLDPAAQACGSVHLVDIGLDLPPAPVEALQADDVAALLPRPSPDAHKYTRGVVGVRAGSIAYPGAAVLATAGACCGLAGMTRFVPPPDDDGRVADLVRSAHPEVVVGDGRVQSWVIGSGGGDRAGEHLAAVHDSEVPLVIDADALTTYAESGRSLRAPVVLTPHAGELGRMLGVERGDVEADQLGFALRAAEKYAATVLLKSRHTVVASPEGCTRVTTVGPPWLATAGAGDVLAGVIGALLAAGLTPYDAASVGSWVHGAAAMAVRGLGPLRAGEVAEAIPDVCAGLLRLPPVLVRR